MSLKNWVQNLVYQLRSGEIFERAEQPMQPNLANGGTGGYKPTRLDLMNTQSLDTFGLPVDGNQQQMNGSGHRTGYSNRVTGAQPAYTNPPYAGQSYGNQPYASAPQQPQQQLKDQWTFNPENNEGSWNWADNARQQQMSREQEELAAQQGAHSYLNVAFEQPDGSRARHLERVLQLTDLAGCVRVMEFMRNTESVIVNTEAIASEAEVQRVVDILSGAAFTLGYSLTKITMTRRAYLLAPACVCVMQDDRMNRPAAYEQQPAAESQAYTYRPTGTDYSGPRFNG